MKRRSWFVERRLDFIDFRLIKAGSVRRDDIMRTFGVSMGQASVDLNLFLALYPGTMRYDRSAKAYVPDLDAGERYASQRGSLQVLALAAALFWE